MLQRSNSFESDEEEEEENEGKHQEEKEEGRREEKEDLERSMIKIESNQEPGRIGGGLEQIDESVKEDAVRFSIIAHCS